MIYLLLDSCVWLDLISNKEFRGILEKIYTFLQENKIVILLPKIIKDEVTRNKAQKINRAQKSIKDNATSFQNNIKIFIPTSCSNCYKQISDNRKAQLDQLSDNENILTNIFSHNGAIEINYTKDDAFMVAGRAVDKQAPFHNSKNNVADALILQQAISYTKTINGDSITFITHNRKDFSDPKKEKELHPELQSFFQDNNLVYSVDIIPTLREIEPFTISRDTRAAYKRVREWPSPNFVPSWRDEDFGRCPICGEGCKPDGYRNLAGAAGWTFICLKCGVTHHFFDPSY